MHWNDNKVQAKLITNMRQSYQEPFSNCVLSIILRITYNQFYSNFMKNIANNRTGA